MNLMKINHGDPDCDIYHRDILIAKVRGGKIMNDKPKAKMTRAEAVRRIGKFIPDMRSAEGVIDFYIAAGMLEIVEEEIPVFEIILNNLDQTHIKIYPNGRIEGISATTINRLDRMYLYEK